MWNNALSENRTVQTVQHLKLVILVFSCCQKRGLVDIHVVSPVVCLLLCAMESDNFSLKSALLYHYWISHRSLC